MKRLFLFLTLILLNILIPAYTQKESDPWRVDPASSRVWYVFYSPFSAQGEAVIHDDQWKKFAKTHHVVYTVMQLTTKNSTRDQHMFKMFEVEEYPDIVFTLKSFTLHVSNAAATGELTMHGVTRTIPLKMRVEETNGMRSYTGNVDLSLKNFGMKPPSFLMFHVQDTVRVFFDIKMKPVGNKQ
jgi:polyisoprenoid-binding protein YceI